VIKNLDPDPNPDSDTLKVNWMPSVPNRYLKFADKFFMTNFSLIRSHYNRETKKNF